MGDTAHPLDLTPEARAGPLATNGTDNGVLFPEHGRPLPGRPFQAGRLEHLHTAQGRQKPALLAAHGAPGGGHSSPDKVAGSGGGPGATGPHLGCCAVSNSSKEWPAP